MASVVEHPRAFGLSLRLEDGLQPPGAWREAPAGGPSLRVRLAPPQAVDAAWSGRRALGWQAVIDGEPFTVEEGMAGDHRFVHGDSIHHLSADAALLQCAPARRSEPGWWRVVLDSVLFSVALLRGYEALHAGAVTSARGAVAITAGAGGGKSTLLAELLRNGRPLLADDVIVLQARGDAAPLAHPGTPLMTVPATVDPAPGEPIATLGGERWVAVPTHPETLPLAALVVLNRSPGLDPALRPARDPLTMLMGALMRFPRTPERERARFEVAGALAAHVPLWELSADPRVAPATLAGLLDDALAGARPQQRKVDLPSFDGQT